MRKLKDYTKKSPTEEKGNSLYGIFLKSLGICFLISFVMIIIYALVLSFTSVSDSSMNITMQVIMIVSITVASIFGGKKIKSKGWLFGLVMGLLFTILLIPLGMGFGQQFSLDKFFVAKLLMGSVVGLIGGVIGVNLN